MSGDRMWCDVMWCEESVFTYDGAVDLGVDGAQPLQLHHGLGLFPLLTAALQAPVEKLHHLSHEQLHQLTDHLYLWHTGGRRDGQTERQTTDRQTERPAAGQTQRRTHLYLFAAPDQTSTNPVDGDLQVVHLTVIVWCWKVVRAEAAEQQSQEEVQQLRTDGRERQRRRTENLSSTMMSLIIRAQNVFFYNSKCNFITN